MAVSQINELSATIQTAIDQAEQIVVTFDAVGSEGDSQRAQAVKQQLEEARTSAEALRGGGGLMTTSGTVLSPKNPVKVTPDQLPEVAAKNYKRYRRKIRSSAEPTITKQPDGGYVFETKIPGRVPGSYALYKKILGPDGTTTGYKKTTITPDGSTAHVKDKMQHDR